MYAILQMKKVKVCKYNTNNELSKKCDCVNLQN